MPDVGDIHHALNLVSVKFQHAHQRIPINVGCPVADVKIIVYRWPAGVERYSVWRHWRKFVKAAREGVI